MIQAPDLYQYPFTPKRITLADGHGISCVDEGQGRAVVFLHGNPSWSYLYRNMITALRSTCRCIAPDHLGCGLSDKPRNYPYRLTDHITNLEQVLDQLEVRTCVLVVHDWGGAIGMGWAGRYPDRVEGLVVLNSAAFRSEQIPWRIAVCRWPLIGPLMVRGMNAFAGAAIHMAVTRKMAPEVAAGFLFPYDSWANRVAVLRFVEDIPLSGKHPSWPELVRVEQGLELLREKPMLLCWGGRDFCFHDAFYREWRRRFPDADCHYYPRAGHYLLEDAFEDVREQVESFLSTAVAERNK
jgi:pimeloyl-ACP methyl ester carboxylesterase